MADVTKHNRKEIGKSYRVIVRGLGIHLAPVNAVDYVPRFISRLSLPAVVETKAVNILREAIEAGLCSGKGPVGMAAAAIYMACVLEDVERTQLEISNYTGITEVTLRNRSKDMAENLGLSI